MQIADWIRNERRNGLFESKQRPSNWLPSSFPLSSAALTDNNNRVTIIATANEQRPFFPCRICILLERFSLMTSGRGKGAGPGVVPKERGKVGDDQGVARVRPSARQSASAVRPRRTPGGGWLHPAAPTAAAALAKSACAAASPFYFRRMSMPFNAHFKYANELLRLELSHQCKVNSDWPIELQLTR